MEGKRVLITGGNSGIGRVTAIELAKLGAEVVLACRDSDKTQAALEQIRAHGTAENLPVDLSSLASVRDLARTFLERYDRLDVLINNAGTFPAKLNLTADGFETQFGVNHLAHFLLTNLLLDPYFSGTKVATWCSGPTPGARAHLAMPSTRSLCTACCVGACPSKKCISLLTSR